jgi:hypothetical protein
VHFFVRAFFAEPIDAFLAHITTIEAALGLRIDHGGKSQPKAPRHWPPGATKRVAARVSTLLGAKSAGDDYCRLFGHRSDFVHGRKMSAIPGQACIDAPRLAQRVINGLVDAAPRVPAPPSRDEYLHALLDPSAAPTS